VGTVSTVHITIYGYNACSADVITKLGKAITARL
jgi:hypothetical protein